MLKTRIVSGLSVLHAPLRREPVLVAAVPASSSIGSSHSKPPAFLSGHTGEPDQQNIIGGSVTKGGEGGKVTSMPSGPTVWETYKDTADTSELTLADVIARHEQDASLTPKRQRDLKSAV